MWKYFNPNPLKRSTGDCVIRAVSAVTGKDWDTTYVEMCVKGFDLKEMPSTDNVWRAYLSERGFKRYIIPIVGYTVKDFCEDNPHGTYLLFVGEHVVAVMDGDYYDTWDSGDEIPSFFFLLRAMS